MAKLSKNFDSSEFACKCGCGYDTPDPELIRMLQAARDLYGKPMIISSGCRCIKHNRAVGGAANSAHITGKAAELIKAHLFQYLLHSPCLLAKHKRIPKSTGKQCVRYDGL